MGRVEGSFKRGAISQTAHSTLQCYLTQHQGLAIKTSPAKEPRTEIQQEIQERGMKIGEFILFLGSKFLVGEYTLKAISCGYTSSCCSLISNGH